MRRDSGGFEASLVLGFGFTGGGPDGAGGVGLGHPSEDFGRESGPRGGEVVFLLGVSFEVVEFDGAAFGAVGEVLTGADGLASAVFPVEVFVLFLCGGVAGEGGKN